jgi:hypothetical protein
VPEPLWEVVGTLLQPDPYARFRSADGARGALGEAVKLLPEGVSDDEPVEIFDQIGPLPEGFGPDGPLPRAARHGPWHAPARGAAGPVEAAAAAGPGSEAGTVGATGDAGPVGDADPVGDGPPPVAGPGPVAGPWPGPGPVAEPGAPNGPYEADAGGAVRAQGGGRDGGPPTHPPTRTDVPGAGPAGTGGPASVAATVPPPPGFAPAAQPMAASTAGPAAGPTATDADVPPTARRRGVTAPSARAVITLLALAAICFALGFAALAASA